MNPLPPGRHPAAVLYDGAPRQRPLPVCDHYCGSAALIDKSLALQATLGPVFDVTADCEDGAAVGAEAEHAAMVAARVNGPGNRFGRLGARVHDPQHRAFEADLATLIGTAGSRLAYLTLPKIESAADLAAAAAVCERLEARAGLAAPVPLQVLVESPRGLRDIDAIAAHPRVETVSFGLMDYVSSFGGAVPGSTMSSPGQFDHPVLARALVDIVLACHAHGKTPAHGVTLEIGDGSAAGADAARAAALGFLRKWSIHPNQVRPIVAGFAPAEDQVADAARILLAAVAAGWGPIRDRDRLHDRASYRYWWQVLQRARLTGRPIDAAAEAAFFEETA